MNAQRSIEELKSKGVAFENKLTAMEKKRIEEVYGFKMPNSLKGFLREGIPCLEGDEFPRWRDFSAENVEKYLDFLLNN